MRTQIFSRVLPSPLCSPELESFHDDQLGMCYRTEIACGLTGEQAAARFRQLTQEGKFHPANNAYVAKLLSPSKPLVVNPTPPSAGVEILTGVLSLLSLGIFSGAACGMPKWPDPESEEKPVRRIRVDLEGDPEIGTLIFIRQSHLELRFKGGRDDDTDHLIETLFYQAEIYDLLSELKPKHLFSEGLSRDFPPSQREELQQYFNELNKPWQKHLAKFKDERVKQRFLLTVNGADRYYAANTEEDIFLHKVQTQEQSEQHKKIKIDEADMSFWKFIINTREEWATREIINFFRDNPGETAVLVFGGAHSFCDDFIRAGFRPHIISVWWESPRKDNTKESVSLPDGTTLYGVPPPCD